jgi:hypothetical protein
MKLVYAISLHIPPAPKGEISPLKGKAIGWGVSSIA